MFKDGILRVTDELILHRDFTYSDFTKTNLAKFDLNAHNNKIGDERNIVFLDTPILFGTLLCKIHIVFEGGFLLQIIMTNPSFGYVLFELDARVEFRDDIEFRSQCLEMLHNVFHAEPPFVIDNIYVNLQEECHSGQLELSLIFFDILEYRKTGIRKPYTGRK